MEPQLLFEETLVSLQGQNHRRHRLLQGRTLRRFLNELEDALLEESDRAAVLADGGIEHRTERPGERGARLGVPESRVAWKRRALGIRCWSPRARWQPHEAVRLGQASDKRIAAELGRSPQTVAFKRRALGIPVFTPRPRRKRCAVAGDRACGSLSIWRTWGQMSAVEVAKLRKQPPGRGRPRHWWFLVAVGLVLGSPFLLAAWVSWDTKRSIRILEERVGSLDPNTFTRPSIPTATNGAQAFLAAGAALVLSDAQKELLTKASKAPEPGEALEPEDAAVMVLGNNRAFELARQALARPDDDWDVDFRLGASAPLPNYLPQLQLARLSLLGGDLVLGGGDRQGAIELAALLARQVDSLYSGGPLIQVLIGRASESFLHRLLQQLLEEPDLSPGELATLSKALPKKDLRKVWLETVRREASFYARDPKEFLAEMSAASESEDGGSEPPGEQRHSGAKERGGLLMGGGVGVVVVQYTLGGSLKWWAKASTQWEAAPADLQRELAVPDSKLESPFGKLRNVLTPDFADALAKFRETAAARELLATALAVRERQLTENLGCATAWEGMSPLQPSPLRFEPLPDGRCRLENLEIAELHRVFPPHVNAALATAEIVLPATTH